MIATLPSSIFPLFMGLFQFSLGFRALWNLPGDEDFLTWASAGMGWTIKGISFFDNTSQKLFSVKIGGTLRRLSARKRRLLKKRTDNMHRMAVLWDLDGTLVDSEPLHEETLVMSLAAEGITPPANLHELVVGMPARLIHETFSARYGLAMPFNDWRRWRSHAYLERAARLQPRAEALEVFRELQALGVPQAVVSNSERLIVDVNLRAIGLMEPDLVSVSRNDVRQGKPEPEGYLRAAWLLALEGADITVVEDSPTGALAGIAAGYRTLLWPQAPMPAPAGAILIADQGELRRRLSLG
ncbi:HAD family phosphatase [Variovorax rhizosphaerae]|uniref:HAD family phosphatase n=1 Tax=Variovorax rhizosphaerae TaxID=1836200 RepID=A0ABU8WDI9_9BURK